MTLKSMRDSIWPYGRLSMHFEFVPEDHDDGEKTFLGRTGISTARTSSTSSASSRRRRGSFHAHMYSFFVADEAPVPEWPV